ncbi:DNA repair exonuclease [Bacillus sp. BRMEA1]|uniref:metallophosphoesterase family protein n=1 Tax=Neobacillus endophyticus TaxID=2738405 RepID=UPI001566A6B5|nr:DNA repair exonuclease [Neobacillus endophyticus]NRD78353.1 DNA repair exonuclease [Neobacillus endophyticus]
MKNLTFIHAADLHLDSPMVGLQHLPANIFARAKESTFAALRKLTDTALKLQVDFVVIAGDIFDGEDRSLRAQSRFRTEMLRLAEQGIPVFIVHGNHDHLNGSWVHIEMPANVHVFSSEVEMKPFITKNGSLVHLYGFSYPTRHVFERKIAEYQRQEGADFHIGILHGNESSSMEHENYAPFTVRELQDKNMDYWALGHIHKQSILAQNPPIIYSGNIQGRNKKETGSKGYYYIELLGEEAKTEYFEAADIIWEEAEADTAKARQFHEILQLCQSLKNQYRKENQGTFLILHLKNIQLDDPEELQSIENELIELLWEDEKDEDSFVWIVELHISESKKIDKEQLKMDAPFYAELFETIDHYENAEKALSPVFQHTLGRKYISHITNEEIEELIQKAEKLLVEILYEE